MNLLVGLGATPGEAIAGAAFLVVAFVVVPGIRWLAGKAKKDPPERV